jgi:hypothetical protein
MLLCKVILAKTYRARRENLDLQAKMAAMQKQIDILSSARLMTKDTQQLGVMPDVHRRVQLERDEARTQLANLHLENEALRADVVSLTKERDALRVAWETAKRKRDEALAPSPKQPAKPSIPPAAAPSPKPPASRPLQRRSRCANASRSSRPGWRC